MPLGGRRVWAGLGLLAILVAGISGCGGQRRESCPGDSCTAELRALRSQIAAASSVVSVPLVSRNRQLEDGEFGTVKITADVADAAGARQLADDVAQLYAHSDVPQVRRVTVDITPSPQRSREQIQESTVVHAVDAGPVACAVNSCTTELDEFRDLVENDFGSVLTVDEITWTPGDTAESVVHATYSSKGIGPQEALDIQTKLARLAKRSGINQLGNLHVFLRYQETVTYSFRYDGSGNPEHG